MYKIYVRINESGTITAINSDAFMDTTDGWIQIDEGEGDKYHHAQGNYLPLGIITREGVFRYKYIDGEIVERTEEEIALSLPPPVKPTEVIVEEQRQTIESLQVQNDLYADLIQELAMVVYS